MNDIKSISADALRRGAEIKEKIEALENELAGILGGSPVIKKRLGRPPKNDKPTMGTGRKKMSAAGRARIAAAARARWAKAKASGKNSL